MQMSSNMHNSQGPNHSDNDLVTDKIIFLTKAVSEMVKKNRFNDQIDDINNQIEFFRKNMKRFVQEDELEATVEMLERKIKANKGTQSKPSFSGTQETEKKLKKLFKEKQKQLRE